MPWNLLRRNVEEETLWHITVNVNISKLRAWLLFIDYNGA